MNASVTHKSVDAAPDMDRTAGPLDVADLDVNCWIDQAIAAGMEPIVLIGPDDERWMGNKCVDLNHDLVPVRYLTDAAWSAIIDGLEARGCVQYLDVPVVVQNRVVNEFATDAGTDREPR